MASDETFRKLRIFVACPGDVEDEKGRLEKLIRTLQFDASNHGFILELAEWRQCVPNLGLPQSIIFEQLRPEGWDIFIGILWTRFGTPSGLSEAGTQRELTGTEAEMLSAIKLCRAHARPRVLLYRSVRPPKSLKDLEGAQLEAVDRFLKECEASGKHPALVKLYGQPDEFERLVSEHLRRSLSKIELRVSHKKRKGLGDSNTQKRRSASERPECLRNAILFAFGHIDQRLRGCTDEPVPFYTVVTRCLGKQSCNFGLAESLGSNPLSIENLLHTST